MHRNRYNYSMIIPTQDQPQSKKRKKKIAKKSKTIKPNPSFKYQKIDMKYFMKKTTVDITTFEMDI